MLSGVKIIKVQRIFSFLFFLFCFFKKKKLVKPLRDNSDRLINPYRIMCLDSLADLMIKERDKHEELIQKLLSRPFRVPVPGYISMCLILKIIITAIHTYELNFIRSKRLAVHP